MNRTISNLDTKKQRRAFTLIEMLVIIAVIAVLAALLMPALDRVQERAHRAICASNLHQIVAACFLYASDFNRKMPPGNATIAPGFGIDATVMRPLNVTMGTAFLVTQGYLPRTDPGGRIFYCPSWKHPFNQYGRKRTIPNGNEYGGWAPTDAQLPAVFICISYCYRSTFGSSCNQPPALTTPNASSTAILADHFITWLYNDPVYGYMSDGFYGHQDGYNTAYLDGHVEWKPDPSHSFYYGNPNWVWQEDWCTQEARWKTFFDLH